MAVSLVQGPGTGTSGTASTNGIGGFPATPTKGNRLFFVVAAPDATANVNTPVGWTVISAGANGTGGTSLTMFTKISAGTENSWLVSWGATGNWAICAFEVAGLSTQVIGADRVNSQAGTGVATITCTLAAATSLPDEFAIFGVGLPNTSGALVSGPTGGFTDITSNGVDTGGFMFCGYKVLSATETSSSTYTWTTNRNPAAQLRTFKGYSLDGPWPVITS